MNIIVGCVNLQLSLLRISLYRVQGRSNRTAAQSEGEKMTFIMLMPCVIAVDVKKNKKGRSLVMSSSNRYCALFTPPQKKKTPKPNARD